MKISILHSSDHGDCVLIERKHRYVLLENSYASSHRLVTARMRDLLRQDRPFIIDLIVISDAYHERGTAIMKMVRRRILQPRVLLIGDGPVSFLVPPDESGRLVLGCNEQNEDFHLTYDFEKRISRLIETAQQVMLLENAAREMGARVHVFGAETAAWKDEIENEFVDFRLQIL